jgi:hypothetical protein
MFANSQIFEAARTLRPNLQSVLNNAELVRQVDRQLAQLLTQTDLEDDTKADRIQEVLEAHPATQVWLKNFLSQPPTEKGGYSPLPGNPTLQPATKYICPIANDYTWYREDGSVVPLCPTHLESLVPAQS